MSSCRKLKQDAVPTVAYSDSFGEGGGSGTLGYYLASAFDQIYVQETGLVSFTGLPAAPHVLSLTRLHTNGMSCLALPCVILALYGLPEFPSFDLVLYTAIPLSDLPVMQPWVSLLDYNCCVPVLTEGLSG